MLTYVEIGKLCYNQRPLTDRIRGTWMDIARQRLVSQRIAQANFEQPEAVVRWMGALQAQDYHQALWAIGARLPAPTLTKVEQAIADGKIIRTWPMRGTIHFVPPEDARWMLGLSAARMIAKQGRRLKQLELDDATLGRAQTTFQAALQGGKRLTRSAILQVLEDAGISTTGQRGYYILVRAAQNGLICLGPMEGKQQTFVLLDEWAPQPRQLSRAESLAELARRYFTSHGPATVHDFAWWAGLTVSDARSGLEASKSGLVAEKIAGKEYWLAADTPVTNTPDMSNTFLLAGFDEYLLGYTDRSAVLDPQHAQKVSPGANGVFFPMIVQAGQVIGTWKRAIKKDKVIITREMFGGMTASQVEAFEAAAVRYSTFLEMPVAFA
jgi:hypothetical protein